MTQTLMIAFAMCFAVGPLICGALLKLPARPIQMIVVMLVGVGASAWSVYIRDNSALQALAALWLAWVLATALFGLAIRKRLDHPRLRRWVSVLAMMATTVPWFGLATAYSMTSA